MPSNSSAFAILIAFYLAGEASYAGWYGPEDRHGPRIRDDAVQNVVYYIGTGTG